ncbi:hypothetical protein SARC_08163 [Sphaeroforma arctica JP610]|uniref:Uncharacterized protein n=1 Tax=Sphaeroforma arctica JP610 TaxID=667725 RepID=A0A0L0FRX2_9EUKA|nr:hypothetical protein SARC_08163 [Sphaeroforma arctica JP610]KNC79444.1 hypothetical protein SARC_08163 [Sphaeroforma arctica JP610]|eukprot:XP_014153346.1 hypothetical protein SARC_08163 [Sphaeroforma arctica JP610]
MTPLAAGFTSEKQRFADSEEFKRLRQTFGPASLAQRERAKQLHTAAAAATGTSEADLRPWPRRLGLTRLECFPTQPRLVLLPECTVFFSTTAHTKKTSSKAFGKAKKTATAPIVRISIRDEKGAIEIGRVPVEVGAFMHPLLQSGLVLFEGELDIGTQALKLGPMGRIAVKVRVRVRKELFTTVAATGKSDFSVGGASEKEDYDERVRAALLQLLMYMGLLAHQGGEFSVTEHGRASVDNDDVDGEGDVDEQLRDTLIATSASLTGHYNHMTMPHQLTASLREYQKEDVTDFMLFNAYDLGCHIRAAVPGVCT